ncbi:hypothetical protein DUNSADRAFT_8381 [Dunaliella salina]|uniref:Encoded protein n=1 Tax=Dunaliella salina TaxID=3046 RepID=A0ABQ7GJR2_DUNSA|nr:hypothetical protein DUNSADRAFT_8381 [Dunaliella salina]|eukprot:KAF5834841.1 hypothetical protein DUNSADRAFT_8381 [Dunaliella salina]
MQSSRREGHTSFSCWMASRQRVKASRRGLNQKGIVGAPGAGQQARSVTSPLESVQGYVREGAGHKSIENIFLPWRRGCHA